MKNIERELILEKTAKLLELSDGDKDQITALIDDMKASLLRVDVECDDTMITEEIFYNKELCDNIRDIVMNSACGFKEAVKLLSCSKNHARDVDLIKRLKNCGISKRQVIVFIGSINC